MRKVSIVGFGLTKFTKEEQPTDSLMLSAIKSLFETVPNLSQKDIDVVLTSTNDNKKYLSSIVSEISGITPKISHSVESLCNSGANSAISAFSYIASGLAEVALVVGAERSDNPGLVLEWDKSRGQYKHPIYWASMFTKSHVRKYGTTREDIAMVSAKNHRNSLDNPYAYFEKSYSIDEIINSKELTEDIRLLDCSFPCSGSAAILLTSEELSKKFTDVPTHITGIGQRTISAGFTKNKDLTSMISTSDAASMAYEMAKKEPSDIDVAEIHDAFSICEIIEVEDLGFAKKGKGNELVRTLYETQDKRINPRGGLIGAGHPLGATGIAQIVEVSQQLQGKAGKRQVPQAKVGLVQNMSAAATSSSVLILQS
ncbi:MAG TPA: thiolase family protein [Nitrosopumilaceae archaeon]|nr:thiolase family protein [Nitrosopumilaceae archaeon]